MPRGQSRATRRLHSGTTFGYTALALALYLPWRHRLGPRHLQASKEPAWAERPLWARQEEHQEAASSQKGVCQSLPGGGRGQPPPGVSGSGQ